MAETIAKLSSHHNLLLKFLSNIHQKTLFSENEDQIKNLEMGVKEIIQKIIKEFYSNGKYDFSEIIHVGSSYEGSKIISPGEFDFMLVLKGLSESGNLRIAEGCQPGMKLVRYKKFARSDSSGPNVVFNNVLGLEIDSVMTDSEEKRQRQKSIKVQTYLGELKIKDISRYTLYLQCVNDDRKFDIGVDLMPSIRIQCDTQEVKRDMTLCPAEIRELAFRDGCFLVGKVCVIDGICWQLSFAAAERNMMKSLSPGHMKIYRVLKYLFVEKSLLGICDLISSYVLKTAVLRHAFLQCEELNPTRCFVAIIRSLAMSMGSAIMQSLFVPSLNLWQRVIRDRIRNITENETICDKAVIDQLSSILTLEGKELTNALRVAVVFEFWKRVFLLISDIFERADYGLLTDTSLKDALTIIFTKLNEEDEEDDIEGDYFEKKNGAEIKMHRDDDWKIYRSTAKLTTTNPKEENCATTLTESIGASVKDNEFFEVDIDDKEEDEAGGDSESQDLEDIDSFLRTYAKQTGEDLDSDEESDSESDDSGGNEELWDEWFVHADQEDVYYLNEKYNTDITSVDISVFKELLGQILECAPNIQNVKDISKAKQIEQNLNDRVKDTKRQKLVS